MPRPGHYLAVYDISDDKERLRVAKLLEGFGFRVQESVFECLLSKAGKRALLEKLQAKAPKSGFVILYRLNQEAEPVSIGARQRPGLDAGLAFVV